MKREQLLIAFLFDTVEFDNIVVIYWLIAFEAGLKL